MESKIEIPLSKQKIILLLVGAIAFVVAGILFTVDPDKFISPVFSNAVFIRVAGIFSILFFGLCLVFIFKKLFDKGQGLIIDEHGITDNSSGTSVGFIAWQDIVGVRTVKVFSQKFVMVDVRDPEQYILKAKNGLLKKAMQANLKIYGSPISIVSSSLKYNFNELESLLTHEFERRNLIK